MDAMEETLMNLPNKTGWIKNPRRPDMPDPFTPGTICYRANLILRYLLAPYAEEWWQDWKLWLGVVIIVVFSFTHVYIHFAGDFQHRHVTRTELIKVCKKIGANWVILHLMQYNQNRAGVRHWAVIIILVPSICLKFFYFWRAKSQKGFIKRDLEVTSIYMRFEHHTVTKSDSSPISLKVTSTFVLQATLLFFYWARVVEVCKGYAYLFWFVSLLVQSVGELDHMFGNSWDHATWRFLVSNAGNLRFTRVNEDMVPQELFDKQYRAKFGEDVDVPDDYDRGFYVQPSKCRIYTHFAMSVICTMGGRQTIIDTIPLFLMTSRTPIDFCLNCVATGFFMSLSEATWCMYKIDPVDGDYFTDEEISDVPDDGQELGAVLLNQQPAPPVENIRSIRVDPRRHSKVPGRFY